MEHLILRGKVNNKGKLLIFGLNDLEEFSKNINLDSNNHGGDVLVTINRSPTNLVARRKAYIHGKIIPDFKQAYQLQGERFTTKQVEYKICQLTTVAKYGAISFEEMNFEELGEFIDELKQIAAEHFNFFIDDSVVV